MRPAAATQALSRLRQMLLSAGIVTLVAALPADAQTTIPNESPIFPYAVPEEVGLSSAKLERLGNEISKWVANGELVGGELLVVKGGRAVFHEAYGWADQEEERPLRRNSVYAIASMTKSYTAAAALMLVDQGSLSLEDPVRRYLPRFPDDSTRIHHLLSHTSGFVAMDRSRHVDPSGFRSLGQWVDSLVTDGRDGSAGQFGYSDYNYIFLARVVERVSGTPFDTFIQERLLAPMRLSGIHTAFAPDMQWAEVMNSRYRWNGEAGEYRRVWHPAQEQPWPFLWGADGLYATAMDHAAFMTMWMNEGVWRGQRILSREVVRGALLLQARADHYRGYGHGWIVVDGPRIDDIPSAFYHGGSHGSIGLAFPASEAIVILMAHTQSRAVQNGIMNRIGMLELFEAPGPYSPGLVVVDPSDVPEVAVTATQAGRYAGTYRGPAGPDPRDLVVRIRAEGERLHWEEGRLGERATEHLHLVPIGDDRFYLGRYREGRVETLDTTRTIRLTVEGEQAVQADVLASGEVAFAAGRANPDRLLADMQAERSRVPIDELLLTVLESEGVEAARARHRALLRSRPDSVRFGESLLGSLGYDLIDRDRIEEAVAVLEMNAVEFGDSHRALGALGDALRAAGRLEAAEASYLRALDLAGGEEAPTLPMYQEALEEVRRQITDGASG